MENLLDRVPPEYGIAFGVRRLQRSPLHGRPVAPDRVDRYNIAKQLEMAIYLTI